MINTVFYISGHFQDFLKKNLLCIFLIVVHSININASTEKIYIYIKEFKNYREYKTYNLNFLVDKKTQDIYVNKNNFSLKLNHQKYGNLYVFSKNELNKKKYFVLNDKKNGKRQIGFWSRKATRYFKETPTCEVKSSYKDVISQLSAYDFLDKLDEAKVDDILDKETCQKILPEEKLKIKKAIVDFFDTKRGQLKICFESKDAQMILDKDLELRQVAGEVFGRYLNLSNNILNSESNFKIKCGLPSGVTNKLAVMTENPSELFLNIQNGKFNFEIENAKTVLSHEIFHYGSQQFQCSKDAHCLDEGFADLFENVCQYNSKQVGVKSPPFSAEIVKRCLKNETIDRFERLYKNDEDVNGTDPEQLLATLAQAPIENAEEAKVVTQALVDSGKRTITPVADDDARVAAMTNKGVVTVEGQSLQSIEGDGKFHQIMADAGFTSSLSRISDSLSTSLVDVDSAITGTIGNVGLVAAAAAVGQKAVAATTIGSAGASSSASYSPMTTTEIVAAQYLQSDPAITKIMNDPKLDSLKYEQKQAYFKSLGKASPGNLAASTDSGVNKIETTNKPTENINVGSLSKRNIASVENVGDTKQKINTVKSNQATTEVEDLKKKSAVTRPDAAGQVETVASSSLKKLDNPIIQRLTVFSEVKEPMYTNIRNSITDKGFRQLLDSRKIRILNEAGKPMWTSSIAPTRCFKDIKNNKVLIQVTCR